MARTPIPATSSLDSVVNPALSSGSPTSGESMPLLTELERTIFGPLAINMALLTELG